MSGRSHLLGKRNSPPRVFTIHLLAKEVPLGHVTRLLSFAFRFPQRTYIMDTVFTPPMLLRFQVIQHSGLYRAIRNPSPPRPTVAGAPQGAPLTHTYLAPANYMSSPALPLSSCILQSSIRGHARCNPLGGGPLVNRIVDLHDVFRYAAPWVRGDEKRRRRSNDDAYNDLQPCSNLCPSLMIRRAWSNLGPRPALTRLIRSQLSRDLFCYYH